MSNNKDLLTYLLTYPLCYLTYGVRNPSNAGDHTVLRPLSGPMCNPIVTM